MNKYESIIDLVFKNNFHKGNLIVKFSREELVKATNELGFSRIKNLGDIPYFKVIREEKEGE